MKNFLMDVSIFLFFKSNLFSLGKLTWTGRRHNSSDEVLSVNAYGIQELLGSTIRPFRRR
ncbi:hypothetical protein VF04_28905 [Nostoc linckia z7]|uniref:Uncharacterized protein n=1 Tax=Nostoc linckia z7 TaxID=1628745 RepID=A0ABX4KF21_NOSLI|nr:hypothetical protein VF05_23775 [Nostoc linckia z3]PHJ70782.1 hypothetical protein VF03_21345 [Nostoc linckia z2]PHJ92093.1 hypothetical protein VF04_28905 [Nostoc linckia z7]